MKTVIYARKSSESEERQIQSIEDQVSALRSTAKHDRVLIDEVLLEARSAKDPGTRPVFKQLVADIEAGRISRLYVWSTNRLSRNLVEGGQIAHLLQTGALKSIRTPEKFYLPDDSALVMSIENGMATSFIQDLRRNVKRGLKSKASKGWAPWRAPIGYINNPVTREIDIDPERFLIVRKAWDMMLTGGYSISQVGRELEKMGLKSDLPKGSNRPVSRNVVYKLFSNPFYKGELIYMGERIPAKHVPMVTGEEYEKVQQLLGRSLDTRPRKLNFVYSGLFRCGTCGCQIVAEKKVKTYPKTGRTVSYTYYHCTNGRRICNTRSVREEQIDEVLAGVMDKIRLPAEFADWATTELAKLSKTELVSITTSADNVEAQIKRNRERLARLNDMRLDGEIGAEEYASLKRPLEVEIQKLESSFERLLGREQRLHFLIAEQLKTASFQGDLSSLSIHEQRGKVRSLGAPHSLTLGKLLINLHPVLRIIAGFEPPESGSGWPKPGDQPPQSSRWYTFLYDIRKIALEEVLREDGELGR